MKLKLPRFRQLSHMVIGALIAAASLYLVDALYPLESWNNSLPYGDASILAYILCWGANSLSSNPMDYYDIPLGHPHDQVLAGMDGMIAQSALIVPIWLFTKNVALVYNLTVYFSFVFAGLASYSAAVILLKSRAAAVAVAALFTITTDRYFHSTGHLNLIFSGFIPLVFVFFYKVIETPAQKWAALAATALGVSIYASNYIFILSALTAGIAVLTSFLANGIGYFRAKVALVGLALLGSSLTALPIILVHSSAAHGVEHSRTSLATASRYQASIPGWFLPPNRPGSIVSKYASPLQLPAEQQPRGEDCQFIGVLVVFCLFLEGLRLTSNLVRKQWTNRDTMSCALLLSGIFLFLSTFGPRFGTAGFHLPGPYTLLHAVVLQFTGFFRIPSRLAFVTEWLFALSVGISFVVFLSNYSRSRYIALAVILAGSWLEHVPAKPALVYTVAQSPVILKLDELNPSGTEALAILPDPRSLGPVAFSTMSNWRPLANAWPDNPLLEDYTWFFSIMANLEDRRAGAFLARKNILWIASLSDEVRQMALAAPYLEEKYFENGQALFQLTEPQKLVADHQLHQSRRQQKIEAARAETSAPTNLQLSVKDGSLHPIGGLMTSVAANQEALILVPEKPDFASAAISFPAVVTPQAYDVMEVHYSLSAPAPHRVVVYWASPEIPMSGRTRIEGKTTTHGNTYVAMFELSEHPDWLWQDKLQSLRFDVADLLLSDAHSVALSSVRFKRTSPSPPVPY